MKILGVLLTWNNVNFFKYAIQQMLDFCDEVVLIEGCHFKQYPKRSSDGTYEYIKTLRHPKLKIIPDFKRTSDRYDKVQLELRKNHSEGSKYWQPGNWIIQWDDDTFFFNDDLPKIRKILEFTDKDTVMFRERRFAYNFRFSLLAPKNRVGGIKCQRITDGCGYKSGISHLHYKDGSKYINKAARRLLVPDIVYHHYPYVRTSGRVKFRYDISVNKGVISNKNTFEIWKRIKWNEDEDILKQENDFRKVIGGVGKFEIYNGKHPEILEDHPWRHTNDVRRP